MDGQMSFQTMKPKMVKTGYARIVDSYSDNDTYLSFRELSYYSDDMLSALKQSIDRGKCRMYCACSAYDDLELSITANNVIRVRNNGLQDRHKESCPKSVRYGAWLAENMDGAGFVGEAEKVVFQITLPGVGSVSNSASSVSSSSGSGSHRIKLLEMVKTLNSMAWEKQTYSKKKAISISRKQGTPLTFQYKNSKEFSHLIYGISNDIYVQYGSTITPFNALYYRVEDFYSCMDYRRRFFIYAEIEKISAYKPERKYQYITLKMPGNKSKSKTVVRVATDKFVKMFDVEDLNDSYETKRILAGYVNHSIFNSMTGESTSEWMTLLKGVAFFVSENGLYAETEYIANVIDMLCTLPIIFKRPYLPLESYRNLIPTILIEIYKGKDILIDIVTAGDKEYNKRLAYGEDNSEYDCIILRDGDDIGELKDRITGLLQKGQRRT